MAIKKKKIAKPKAKKGKKLAIRSKKKDKKSNEEMAPANIAEDSDSEAGNWTSAMLRHAQEVHGNYAVEFHGKPMEIPWKFHGIPCNSDGIPWNFH